MRKKGTPKRSHWIARGDVKSKRLRRLFKNDGGDIDEKLLRRRGDGERGRGGSAVIKDICWEKGVTRMFLRGRRVLMKEELQVEEKAEGRTRKTAGRVVENERERHWLERQSRR